MQLVARRISDERVLKLIEQMLRAPIQEGKELTVPEQGTPQGGFTRAFKRTVDAVRQGNEGEGIPPD